MKQNHLFLILVAILMSVLAASIFYSIRTKTDFDIAYATVYHPNDSLKVVAEYQLMDGDTLFNGQYFSIKNDEVVSSFHMANNKMIGDEFIYLDGSLAIQNTYKNGTLTDTSIFFSSNGRPDYHLIRNREDCDTLITYLDDNKEAFIEYYYMDGKPSNLYQNFILQHNNNQLSITDTSYVLTDNNKIIKQGKVLFYKPNYIYLDNEKHIITILTKNRFQFKSLTINNSLLGEKTIDGISSSLY